MIGKLGGVLLILGIGAVAGEFAAHGAHSPSANASSAAPVRACGPAPRFLSAAYQNSRSLQTATWSVFGRPEIGWAIYAPLAAHWTHPDAAEGPKAFMEKREPDWAE